MGKRRTTGDLKIGKLKPIKQLKTTKSIKSARLSSGGF